MTTQKLISAISKKPYFQTLTQKTIRSMLKNGAIKPEFIDQIKKENV